MERDLPLDTDVVDPPQQVLDNVDGVKDDAGAARAAENPAAADPSTATDASKPEGALSVVRDVVAARKEDPAAAPSATGEEEPVKTGDQATKEPDDKEYSDVPFNKHPRFIQVIGKLKAAEQDAGRYRNVQGFLDSNGVTADEAAETLTVAALAKTNPAEAWKRVQPWVQKLLIAAGEVLPDDLQQQVAEGKLTQEAALQVSRANALVEGVKVQRTFEQQRAERQQQTDVANARLNAAASWESDRRIKDPNFAAKEAALQREVAYLIHTEGQPKTAEGVTDQLQRAYAAVNKSFKPPVVVQRDTTGRFQPRAITPVTGGQVAAAEPAKPQTTLEIVRANRARRAG